MDILISPLDYNNPAHSQALVQLIHHYAMDKAGGNRPLESSVYRELPLRLGQLTTAFSFLASADQQWVGLVNCFEGFSTFSCQALINIHDLIVHRDYRGRGIGGQLLRAVEQEAIARNCCKITLEVLEHNHPARQAYQKFGFENYELDSEMGRAIFLEKKLAAPDL